MSIKYTVHENGRWVHAIAAGIVTDKDIIAYEIAFASDGSIRPPADELFEIKPGAVLKITQEGIDEAFERKKRIMGNSILHRCAIVVSYHDDVNWKLAKFYETMVRFHSPKSVIVFGDIRIAKTWMGIQED